MTDNFSQQDLYQLAYEREKRARKETESILEQKTLELFNSNQELVETNEKLRQQQKSLVRTEKMAALGELSAGIAHEINNPLAFVISNTRSLQDYFRSLSELVEVLSREELSKEGQNALQACDLDFVREDSSVIFSDIQEGLDRVRDIVTNLKSFSRTKTGDRESVDVNDTLRSALKIVNNEVKYHCHIHESLCDIPNVYGNRNELIQVFLNVILNAAQAIPDKGNIWVSTERCDEEIKVVIKDDGDGIEEKHLDRIFNPFFTNKPVGEGTGLGLSVSYGIIKDLNGKIYVNSVLGEGAEFSIHLPTEQRKSRRRIDDDDFSI